MNRNVKISESEIDRLVGGYFEASLNERDEYRLARILSSLPAGAMKEDWSDAMAILSLSAVARSRNPRNPRNRIPLLLKSAAAVAVVVAVGIAAIYTASHGRGDEACYAYVNGELISDPQDISSLMESQMGEMASAQEAMIASVNMDFAEMSQYIDD